MENKFTPEEKQKETFERFAAANRSVWVEADFILIKWKSINTERGDEILTKTKQSQMKGMLNEQLANVKEQDETRNYCRETKNKTSKYVSVLGIKNKINIT